MRLFLSLSLSPSLPPPSPLFHLHPPPQVTLPRSSPSSHQDSLPRLPGDPDRFQQASLPVPILLPPPRFFSPFRIAVGFDPAGSFPWDSILPDLFCGSQIRSLCIFRGQLPLPPAPPPSPLPPPSKSPFGSTCRHFHRFCLFHCFVFPLFAPFEVFCRRCCRNEAKQKTNAATESKQ